MPADSSTPHGAWRLQRRSLLAGAVGAAASSPLWATDAQQEASPLPPSAGPPESVARFGALGNGRSGTADQAGLRRAVETVNRSGRYVAGIGASYWAHPQDGLFVPAGVYDAGDLDITGNASPFAALSIWAIPGSVVVRIPDGTYFLEADERLNWLYVSGINFVGGKGAFCHRFEGTNVNGKFVFERCVFDNYTECAIGNNAGDQPYLEVRSCTFMAAEKSAAIGIAWGGYADGCIIEGNAFLRNRYHLKIGPNPSGSIHVLRNDFLRWDTSTRFDAAIWLVPSTVSGRFDVNAGWGTIISGNKFGNENMAPSDIRILVAREGEGETRQTRAPLQRFDAGGADGAFLAGTTIENNRVASVGNTSSPFMRSWIAEIRNLAYLNNRHDGGRHSYLCEFMGARTGDYANLNWTVPLDSASSILGSSPFGLGIANAPVGPQHDAGATQALAEETILVGTGGDDTSFVLLASADTVGSFVPSDGDVALTPVTDHRGHSRAVEVMPRGLGAGLAGALTGVVEGHQGWLAVDLCRGRASSADAVEIHVFNHATGAFARRMRYVLPQEWRRLRLPFTLPASPSPTTWQYRIIGASGATGWHFRASRLYVYHGREPRADGHIATLGDGKWNGSHLMMGNTHIWEEGGSLYFKVGHAPRSPNDGSRIG